MKAVNLIPADSGGGAHGRSGGIGAYVVIAVLALLVLMSGAYTVVGRSLADKRADLAAVTAQADTAEAAAGDLKSYTTFAELRKSRVATVRDLAKSRFDWAHALDAVARTIPPKTWLTGLRATVNPTVGVPGTSDPLRASLAVPALEIAGCTTSQSKVATTMSSLRRITGVQRVSLSSSAKAPKGSTASAAGEGCGDRAQFAMTVFFEAPSAVPTQTDTQSQAQAAAPAATGGATK
jgi:Tfp pilus assembly protein PilN